MRKKLELKIQAATSLSLDEIMKSVREVLFHNDVVVIFGAGTLAKKVCDELTIEEKTNLMAFVDNRVGDVFEPFDEPVFCVYQLKYLKFDKLLLLHPTAEPEMRAQALSYGVPEEKIVGVFSD